MDSELILIGLFRHLIDRGYPLGIRDYRDALFALRNGVGTLQRERLLWLCRTLWARTDEEVTWLERLFQDFPEPSASELAPWLPSAPALVESMAGSQTAAAASAAGAAPPLEELPELRFQAAAQTGTALPRALLPVASEEPFIYTPRPALSLRSLIVCWRRFRRAQRVGPKVDIDVAATILEKCRTGILRAPVLSAARQNQAALLVLADASASMLPFAAFFRTLEESLAESRLRWSKLLYFENVPSDTLYETESFLRPVEMKNLLRDHAGTPLMIISDAGAARGARNRRRLEATREFFSTVGRNFHPVVWMNPMPRSRWSKTSAEQIARFPSLSMLPLNEEGMLTAIDSLRGLKDVA
jgi:uncharacterized protein with von Willebrand factor type A (vWA) domain